MRLSIIVAVSENGVIGRGEKLPWHLPRDLKHFKRLTMGHHLLLGRKTFDTIGRPLPGRKMVVLTRGDTPLPASVARVGSLDEAIAVARDAEDSEAFVAGGETIYRQALSRTDRLYLTRVHTVADGDVRFPELDAGQWVERSREHYPVSEQNDLPLTFFMFERAPEAPVQSSSNADDR